MKWRCIDISMTPSDKTGKDTWNKNNHLSGIWAQSYQLLSIKHNKTDQNQFGCCLSVHLRWSFFLAFILVYFVEIHHGVFVSPLQRVSCSFKLTSFNLCWTFVWIPLEHHLTTVNHRLTLIAHRFTFVWTSLNIVWPSFDLRIHGKSVVL